MVPTKRISSFDRTEELVILSSSKLIVEIQCQGHQLLLENELHFRKIKGMIHQALFLPFGNLKTEFRFICRGLG